MYQAVLECTWASGFVWVGGGECSAAQNWISQTPQFLVHSGDSIIRSPVLLRIPYIPYLTSILFKGTQSGGFPHGYP